LPNLPKTRNEVHNVLEEIDIIYENEQFLLHNDIESGIVLFSTKTNLEYLVKFDTLYVDGTFQYCTKYFTQLFTIHGFLNKYYISLAFFVKR